MKQRLLIALLFLLSVISLHAQQVSKAECFFNTDPGVGNGTPIALTSGDNVTVNANIPVPALPGGMNFLFIRVANNNGTWSMPELFTCWVTNAGSQVAKAEYFFNTDPGVGNGTAIPITPGDNITVNAAITTPNTGGANLLFVRTATATGLWSLPELYFIWGSSATQKINGAEYFFDTDPGIGNATPFSFSAGDSVSMVQNITVPSLSAGPHSLFLRTKNTDGTWSQPEVFTITICSTYGPKADFTYTLEDGFAYFTNNSTAGTSWKWDFGDGKTDTATAPTHKFNTGPGKDYTISLVAVNTCGTDTLRKTIGIKGINAISPSTGISGRALATSISGFGFKPGCTAILRKPGVDTVTAQAIYLITPLDLDARFDLAGADTGKYDLIVSIPGDTTYTLSKAFTVKADGGHWKLVTQASNRHSVLKNGTTLETLIITNTGQEDAIGVPIFMSGFYDEGFMFDELDKKPLNNIAVFDTAFKLFQTLGMDSSVMNGIQKDTGFKIKSTGFLLPMLRAGSSTTYRLQYSIPSTGTFTIASLVVDPILQSNALLGNTTGYADLCLSSMLKLEVKNVTNVTVNDQVWDSVFTKTYKAILQVVTDGLAKSIPSQQVIPMPAIFSTILAHEARANATLQAQLNSSTFKKIIVQLMRNFSYGDNTAALGSCYLFTDRPAGYRLLSSNESSEATAINPKKCDNPYFRAFHRSTYELECPDGIASFDPNEKLGYGKNGTTTYIQPGQPLKYTIFFENLPTATAPAKQVRVVDTLDLTKVNLSTFRFNEYGWSDTVFNVLDSAPVFRKMIDLRPGNPNYLKAEGSLDIAKGIITWNLQTVDTSVFRLTTVPEEGFLPPDVNKPEGQGFVSFTVYPKPGLSTNDEIKNKAVIYFDFNTALATNTWVNKIDKTPPDSKVISLQLAGNDTTVRVSWKGTDVGAGILHYSIYVSTNGGAYALWQKETVDTVADFPGKINNSYAFYSVASDSALNIELPPSSADASIQLKLTPVSNIDPDRTRLLPNIPNPFSGITRIPFELQRGSMVSLELFDITGKRIVLINNSRFTAGSHFYDLNASHLVNGIYIIRLTIDNTLQYQEKAILIR